MSKEYKVKFRGIDFWGRPVFKHVSSNSHFGSTNILFDGHESEAEVLSKIESSDLEYFGQSFDCEPNGGIVEGIMIVTNDEGENEDG